MTTVTEPHDANLDVDAPTTPMLGILGGMGPHATVDFYRRLVERTPASSDQEHLRVAMWADPTVPDRTAALLGNGPSPVQDLLTGVRWLENAGANYIAIPCNTAHAFLDELRAATEVDIVDMVSAALDQARLEMPTLRRIGILATRGTRAASLYENAARPLDLDVVQVTDQVQAVCVDEAIAVVKGGGDLALAAALLLTAAQDLHEAGAEAVVAACTEIPVALHGQPTPVPVVDATSCLVDAVLARIRPTVAAAGSGAKWSHRRRRS